MKRPVFVWLSFGMCLLAATAAVAWLTNSALRSERQAEQARQQALFESELSNALWRMDSLVAPLIAIENGRPFLQDNSFRLSEYAPALAPRLVLKYVVKSNAHDEWKQVDPQRQSVENVRDTSAYESSTFAAARRRLDAVGPSNLNNFPFEDVSLSDLVTWPRTDLQPPQQGAQGKTAPAQQISQADLNPPQQGAVGLKNSAGQEAQKRSQLVQQFSQLANSQGQQANNRLTPLPPFGAVSLPVQRSQLRAMWLYDELILFRTSRGGGCELTVLNWPEWEKLLTSQLGSLESRVRLLPVHQGTQTGSDAVNERQMVSLPIRLEARFEEPEVSWPQSLFVVWGLLLLAGIAVGWLMAETLSLSERRAAFVSAVTHELITPLTTFRLYSEMLSDGLVTDPDQQQTYFRTLYREANRLMHLVENVLAFARLERGRTTARNETLNGADLMERCQSRLQQRVAETPLTLTIQVADNVRKVQLATNAIAVEQVLFNLVDNACKYARDASDPRLICTAEIDRGDLCVRVSDFGPGLSDSARRTLFQPFQKSSAQAAESAPGIGLGLALSHRLARELGGELTCTPNRPTGLCFELRLPTSGRN